MLKKENKVWCVYMLQCKDGSIYTGMSGNLVERLAQHKCGRGSKYVRSRLPFMLKYVEVLSSKVAALQQEAQIKKLKRTLKLELIDGDIG